MIFIISSILVRLPEKAVQELMDYGMKYIEEPIDL
jgi:hypothetical protein